MGALTDYAETILASAKKIEGYLENNDLQALSFDEDAPAGIPFVPELQLPKAQLDTALFELQLLAGGPAGLYTQGLIGNIHDNGTLNVLNEYNFWAAVPLKVGATYTEISTKVGLPEEACRRILRYSFVRRIFEEVTPGGDAVKHTMLSAAVANSPTLRSLIGHCLGEVNPAATNLADALKYYQGDIIEPNKSAAAYTFFRDKPDINTFFEWLESPGEHWRSERFGNAMNFLSQDPEIMGKILHQSYDWNSLGPFTFVDVGGSIGHISFEMAKKYPQMKAIVQDLPGVSEPFKTALPAELKDQVSFETHDFFKPQTREAEIFFLKFILHDWSDPYAKKILQNIIPVMKPNTRIMIMEFILPIPGTAPLPVVRFLECADMQMLATLNSKERGVEDWVELLKQTDERLELVDVHVQPDTVYGLVEVKLRH